MTVLATEVKKGEHGASRLQWILLRRFVTSYNGTEVDWKQFHKRVSKEMASIALKGIRYGQFVEFVF